MPKSNDSDGLTDMQKAFADHYAFNRNGAAAARAAGYSGDGDQLAVVASRLLTNVKVKKYLKSVVLPVLKNMEISKELILAEIQMIAFADLKQPILVKVGAKNINAYVKRSDKLAALKLYAECMGVDKGEGYEGGVGGMSFHWHEGITPEEARKELVAFLRQQ